MHSLTGWLGSQNPRQDKNWVIYKAFFLISTIAMYFTLVNDKVIILFCFG